MKLSDLKGRIIEFIGIWENGEQIIINTEGHKNEVTSIYQGEINVKDSNYRGWEIPINDNRYSTINLDENFLLIKHIKRDMISIYKILS